MSKMKDMAMTIEELRSAAAAINDVADWLTQQFSGNADEPKEQPKKEPELKLEDVRAVLAPCSRSTVPPSSPESTRQTTKRF